MAVNCAALPDNLLESEFFGRFRGAFTGAISDRKGRFQLAHNGTLFLDEIADLAQKGQADLLRVLEMVFFVLWEVKRSNEPMPVSLQRPTNHSKSKA